MRGKVAKMLRKKAMKFSAGTSLQQLTYDKLKFAWGLLNHKQKQQVINKQSI